MKHVSRLVVFLLALLFTGGLFAQNTELQALHVEGRYLCTPDGTPINLHGFGQTYSPWFNEQGRGWGWSYNTDDCLRYNQGLIDKILDAGWEMRWLRLHMDPYWSNEPGVTTSGENDISAFRLTRFKKYLDEVFVPMAEYATSHGLYVVMRPPGVCPKDIFIGGEYQKYLLTVWGVVASHERLRNNPGIMFELANEPINILGTDGTIGSVGDAHAEACSEFFQAIVDSIRSCGADNVLWVPGLGYQSQYAGYVKYPIQGDNIGYAVHCYPGWYGSDSESDSGSAEQGVVTKGAGYLEFQSGWNAQVAPVAEIAPILITEMDWAPQKYNASWGKATTGTAGGVGFGANFRFIMDRTGNVSWMLFTGPELLAKYDDSVPDGQTFLTDPEACARPCYRWFKEYADPNWQFEDTLAIRTLSFPGSDALFNPSIWEKGTYDASTGCLITGQYGFGGWNFPLGIDLSAWKYLVVVMRQPAASNSWSFRLFDENNYWTGCYQNDFGRAERCVVPLHEMYRAGTNVAVDPSHIYIAGFWSYGNTPIYIDHLYLTNNDDYSEPDGLETVNADPIAEPRYYTLQGFPVKHPQAGGIYIKASSRASVK
ncbi:MAG: cellulase family glycosylhydrolase [Bacteroidales bacterium]|nr:cellulase family glycosylhydrolase [Bacteroidales bacterium]